MKRFVVIALTAVFFILLFFKTAQGWGFWGHKKISELAVFTLPPEMFGFYKSNIGYLIAHATAADKRRRLIPDEAPKHFLDLDHYKGGLSDLPLTLKKAEEKFGEDSLQAHGILPWSIEQQYFLLVKAFRERDKLGILKHSSDLAHYLADAHVPLHTTSNYNGQLTGQSGIHAFWESRIPELFGNRYHLFTPKAHQVRNIRDEARKIIGESHAAVDSVLRIEKETAKTFPPDRQFSLQRQGRKVKQSFSESFSGAYQAGLNGMVERKLKRAILNVGSFWYSAWVEAGQPELVSLSEIKITEEKEKRLEIPKKIKGHED